jgi:hypothetical protein
VQHTQKQHTVSHIQKMAMLVRSLRLTGPRLRVAAASSGISRVVPNPVYIPGSAGCVARSYGAGVIDMGVSAPSAFRIPSLGHVLAGIRVNAANSSSSSSGVGSQLAAQVNRLKIALDETLDVVMDNIWAISTMKRRRSKMNKHKLKKRRKKLRMNTKLSRN